MINISKASVILLQKTGGRRAIVRNLLNWLIFFLMFGLSACGGAEAPSETPPTTEVATTNTPSAAAQAYEGRIVAMGDSLTEGLGVNPQEAYPALLAQKLAADGYAYEVINSGISGETSSGALSRADWVLKLAPDIIILETGANDSFRGVDLALTESNIQTLIQALKGEDRIIILAGMQTLQNLGPEYTEQFASIFPKVAETEGVSLIPFFLEGVAAIPEYNQDDGIHPNAAGYELILETLYPYVLEAIAQHQAQSP